MARPHDIDSAIFISRFEDPLELASMRTADQAGGNVVDPISIACDHERRQPIVPNKSPGIMRRHSVAKKGLQPKFMRRQSPNPGLVQPDNPMRRLHIRESMQSLAHEQLAARRPAKRIDVLMRISRSKTRSEEHTSELQSR